MKYGKYIRGSISVKYFYGIAFFLFFLHGKISAQSLGNGADGSPTISGIVNRYTFLVKDAARCDGELLVDNSSGFFKDDLILIIQMQGATINDTNAAGYGTVLSYETAGNYEYAKIASTDAQKLVLQYALLRNYSSAGKTQIVRVPQYQSPIIAGAITCPAWNGSTGGIVAIDATGTLSMNADISAVGTGFRGGLVQKGNHIMTLNFNYYAQPDPTYYSRKGEGVAFYGISPYISGRGAPANGGGGGNIHTSGGGGGSNVGCGGDGGWGYPVDTTGNEKFVFGIGGYPLQYTDTLKKIFMGGGGGAGHEHFGNGTSGANGGGMIFITCDEISGNGNTIYASGSGAGGSGAYGDGAGGGGGGGSICVAANNFSSQLNLNTAGGIGGSTITKGFGPGGGGGGGMAWISSASLPSVVSVDSAGGTKGKAGGSNYGGSDGCSGNVHYNLNVPFNNYFPAVHAGFFAPLSDLPAVAFQNLSTGATSYLWDFGEPPKDTTFEPKHTFPKVGIKHVVLVASNSMCSDTTTQAITTGIANVFTPNGDGKNDSLSFTPFVSPTSSVEFSVFNRWGNLVFEGDNGRPSWDGKDQAEGTYYYIAKIKSDNTEYDYKGYILLIK